MRRLLLLVPALLALVVCAAPTAHADPNERAPRVVLDSVAPAAPGPGDTLTITGAVDNSTSNPQPDVSVRMRLLHSPLRSRGEVDEYGSGQAAPAGLPMYGHDVDLGDIDPHGQADFRLHVPVNQMHLSGFGVYLIAVEALTGTTQLAIQRTFMVFVPKDKNARPQPTRVSWLWPLADRPHQLLGNRYSDDTLAKKISGTGRLNRLVQAGASAAKQRHPVPITWAIDPDLLHEVATMSDGYRVRSQHGLTRGTGKAAASAFLDRTRSATHDSSVLSLPYASVDTAALARAGLSADVTLATTRGQQITRDVLDVRPISKLAWPPGGLVDQQSLDAIAATGNQTVILRADALPLAETLTYTPDPVTRSRTASGPVTVLLTDKVLTDVLGSATHSEGSAALTQQRFLAETALITAERPNDSRGLIVAPPRRWNPPDGLAAALLRDTSQVPWLAPTKLADQQQRPPTTQLSRQRLRYPAEARHAELNLSYLARVRRLRESLANFSAIFNPPPKRIADYNLATLRAESSAWRNHKHLGRSLIHSTTRSLRKERAKVHILRPRNLSLASSQGSIPLTVENKLNEPVTVRLRVSSVNPGRMYIRKLPKSLTLPARQKVTVQVPIRTVTSGVVRAEARLFTPDGAPYSDPVSFTVLSTAYGTVAIVITVGALVVLFAGSGYRVARRIRRARRTR